MTSTITPTPIEYSADGKRIWRIGTLTYSLGGLSMVFFWMLLGDFCFNMMEMVVAKLVPLTVKDLDASDRSITVLTATIPFLLNTFMTPLLGYRSDRLRTRWGRRIPYLIWPTPFIMLGLIALGYNAEIGAWLQSHFFGTQSTLAVTFWAVAIIIVVFQFFNMVIQSVYYWLFNDVVPEHLLGRFYGMFRVVGNAAGFIYNTWIFGYADTHRKEMYVGAGIIYFVSFALMCWRVREGQYPPPDVPKGAGMVAGFKTFVAQCFSMQFYWWFYGAYGLMVVGNALTVTFRVFFAREKLGMTLFEIGRVDGIGLLLGTILAYPLGWVADKFHAIRLYIVAVVLMGIVCAGSVAGIHDKTSYWIFTLLWGVANITFSAANAPLFPQILPKAQFGQFAGATSLVTALMSALLSLIGGQMLDWSGHSYRLIYVWNSAFSVAALLCTLMLYRQWLKHGGPEAYVAPVASAATE
jgi:MFS family permease